VNEIMGEQLEDVKNMQPQIYTLDGDLHTARTGILPALCLTVLHGIRTAYTTSWGNRKVRMDSHVEYNSSDCKFAQVYTAVKGLERAKLKA